MDRPAERTRRVASSVLRWEKSQRSYKKPGLWGWLKGVSWVVGAQKAGRHAGSGELGERCAWPEVCREGLGLQRVNLCKVRGLPCCDLLPENIAAGHPNLFRGCWPAKQL